MKVESKRGGIEGGSWGTHEIRVQVPIWFLYEPPSVSWIVELYLGLTRGIYVAHRDYLIDELMPELVLLWLGPSTPYWRLESN